MGNRERSRAERRAGRRRWSPPFNLTRLICLPHLSGFYFLLLAGPLSNLFGRALTHDAGRRPEGHSHAESQGRSFLIKLRINVRRSVTKLSPVEPFFVLKAGPGQRRVLEKCLLSAVINQQIKTRVAYAEQCETVVRVYKYRCLVNPHSEKQNKKKKPN